MRIDYRAAVRQRKHHGLPVAADPFRRRLRSAAVSAAAAAPACRAMRRAPRDTEAVFRRDNKSTGLLPRSALSSPNFYRVPARRHSQECNHWVQEAIIFVKNAWYCAGWDHELSQGKTAVLSRRIAGESVVPYRKLDGAVVALEDRCPHRQAALSLGRKEGDSLRCMYHGMKFGPDGQCNEIPGQTTIPERACVRAFPVVEKDNWIWVWMGDAVKADPALICFSVGPGDAGWNIKTSQVHVKTNYRLEIANLMDLTHIAWVHDATFGGTREYELVRPRMTMRPRGIDSDIWLRNVPVTRFAQHLFPPDMRFDLHFDVQFSVPCNFVLHFKVYVAGTATEGPSDGQLVLDSYSCQAVTPCDADSVQYYYSWGASRATDSPGLSDLLKEAIDAAFLEDKLTLEAQHRNISEKPDFKTIDIVHDAGPGKMLWLLDKMLKEEAAAEKRAIPIAATV